MPKRLIAPPITTPTHQDSLNFMRDRVQGCGGAVGLDSRGNVAIAHTTERMAWAFMRDSPDETSNVLEDSGTVR